MGEKCYGGYIDINGTRYWRCLKYNLLAESLQPPEKCPHCLRPVWSKNLSACDTKIVLKYHFDGLWHEKEDRYVELCNDFPLRPIKNEEQLELAISCIDDLLDKNNLCPKEQEYLDVLSTLVEQYESKHQPIQYMDDTVILSHLMQSNGIFDSVLAEKTGIARSTISMIMSGKRKMTRTHIERFAKLFNVSPMVFFEGK